jgi:hypothetical protein
MVQMDLHYTRNIEITHHQDIKMELQPKDTSRGHFYVSLVKSVFRIGAGACLMAGFFWFAGFLLIFAEMLGILEELV